MLPVVKTKNNQLGSGLTEIFVSMSILGLIALATTYGITTAIVNNKKQHVQVALIELAQDKVEDISVINPNLLNSTDYDESEHHLTLSEFPNLDFTRITDVSVDNSTHAISLTVTTSCNHPNFPVSKTISKTLLNS